LNEVQAFLTSGDGRFVFAGLAPGKYSLAASRTGYARQGLDQHESFWTGVVTGPRIDSEHKRFRLGASAVLTGVVTDEWGDPVRNGSVMLFQQSMFEGSRSLRNINQTVTDDQGRYRFAHLLVGTYVVAVHATPWFARDQALQSYALARLRTAVSSGAQVEPESGDATNVIADVQPLWSPNANALFDVVYPVTYFPNASRLADAARLSLGPGATQIADVQLRTVPSIHLRVRAPAEPPAAVTPQEDGEESVAAIDTPPSVDLSLRIGDTSIDQLQPTRTEIAPGLFELSGIPPGEFTLSATSFPFPNANGTYVSREQSLSLSGDTDVDLHPHGALATVSGTVLLNAASPPVFGEMSPAPTHLDQSNADDEGAGIGITVILRSPKSGDSYEATISQKREFTFVGSLLPPGSYEVELGGGPGSEGTQSNLRVSSVEATGAVVSGRSVEIPGDQPVKLVVRTSEAKATLAGFALKNGKPVSGAMILLVPQDPGRGTSVYHRDQSDSDGSFSMAPLFPGKYTLLAIENGWDLEWSDAAVLFHYLPGGQPVEIPSDGSVTCNAKVQ
jgi:hypothetical protein